DILFDEFLGGDRKLIIPLLHGSPHDDEIPALDVATLTHALRKAAVGAFSWQCLARDNESDAPWFRSRLRPRGERMQDRGRRRAAKKNDEFPPSHAITRSARTSVLDRSLQPINSAALRLITSQLVFMRCQ